MVDKRTGQLGRGALANFQSAQTNKWLWKKDGLRIPWEWYCERKPPQEHRTRWPDTASQL